MALLGFCYCVRGSRDPHCPFHGRARHTVAAPVPPRPNRALRALKSLLSKLGRLIAALSAG